MRNQSATFVVPGSLERRTGGTIYDREIVRGLERAGWDVAVLELEGDFPFPSPTEAGAARARLAALSEDTTVVVDGLALGALPGALDACPARAIALVHHPLADETGLDEGERARLLASERVALEGTRDVVVTSAFTRARLGALELAAGARIHVVEPGVAFVPEAPAPERSTHESLRLVSVGAVTPRKAYTDVAEAVPRAQGADLFWTHVGSSDDASPAARALRARVAEPDLAGRVDLAGVLSDDNVAAALSTAHVFVHPAHYEGYGMAPREALAHGLPIVTSTGGALAEFARSDCALSFEPGDVEALAAHLRALARDRDLYRGLRDRALGARARTRRWDDAAHEFAGVLGGAR